MKRTDYQDFKWYPVTDDTYWIDGDSEFKGCRTIVVKKGSPVIYTMLSHYIGWGTMAKYGDWFFMIINTFQEDEQETL